MHRRNSISIYFSALLLLLAVACGPKEHHDNGAHQDADHPEAEHGAGHDEKGSDHGSTPADDADAHGHSHGAELEAGALKPLMQEMLLQVEALNLALESGQDADAVKAADRLATICDGGDEVNRPTTSLFGPNFTEWDKLLHSGAAKLAAEIRESGAENARSSFESLVDSCRGCHQQAPLAFEVEVLGSR